MLDVEKAMAVFSLFSDLSGDALERWRPSCTAACRRLERRLRENVNMPAEMEGLCTAAAIAYGDLLMLDRGGAQSDEIQVGNIRLKNSTGSTAGSDAQEIATHFLQGIAHLLKPDCPVLLAVEETV